MFLIFTLVVVKADVKAIGPLNSTVGLAGINKPISDFIGLNMLWYHITDWLGFVGIFTALGFSLLGLVQLIKRKSFKKVDPDLYILGAIYVIMIAFYCFFEIKVVNYRPVLIDTYPQASYPSSHTMLICSIMGTAILQFSERIHNKIVKTTAITLSLAVILITVAGRLICGVHWFTDIVGGLLLSASFVVLYYSCVSLTKRNQSTKIRL